MESKENPRPVIYVNKVDPLPDEVNKLVEDHFCVLYPNSPDLNNKRKMIGGMLTYGNFDLFQPIDDKLFDQFPALKVIGTCSVGYDHIDIPACISRGIKVGNTPGVLDNAVADMAFALLLSSARRICEGDNIAHDPFTQSFDNDWLGYQVTGATLGIVGMGRIGTKIAQRALGFKMKILYNNRRQKKESVEKTLSAEYYPSLHEMLPECDFVVSVVPGTEENDKMFSTKEFGAMKKTGIFVNIGRGSVVDQEALTVALTDGTIAAAGIDVTNPEPLPRDHPLLKIGNLIITPHAGTSTMNTIINIVQITIHNILCGLEGKPLLHEVTTS